MTVIEKIREENSYNQNALNILKQENAHLKYLLSEMVDKNEDRYFLAMAEHFQNELLKKDEEINNVLKNALEFETGLNHLSKNKTLPDQVMEKHFEIRGICETLTNEFSKLSNEFQDRMRRKTLI